MFVYLTPPLDYLMWQPLLGACVRQARQFNRRIVRTANRAAALELPASHALRVLPRLIRPTGQLIEFRPVQRVKRNQQEMAS